MQVTVIDASCIMTNLATSDLLLDRQLASTNQDKRGIGSLLIDQIEFADVLILNKTDLVRQSDLGKITAVLRKLNSAASILPAVHCDISLDNILNTKR